MDIRHLAHVHHAIQVIQITLPTTVQISQASPVAVQHATRHITAIQLTIIMYRLIDTPVIIHLLLGRRSLKLPVTEDSGLDISGVFHHDRAVIDPGRGGGNRAVCRVTYLRRIFLRIQHDLDLSPQGIYLHRGLDLVRERERIDTHPLQNRDIRVHTRLKILPTTILLRSPSDLGDRQGTREHHILQMLLILDILRPCIRLYP